MNLPNIGKDHVKKKKNHNFFFLEIFNIHLVCNNCNILTGENLI